MFLMLVIAFGACVVRTAEQSPLVTAARSGDVATIRALAAHGADLNAPSGGNNWTPLMHAVHKNQLGTAAALIEAGAQVDRAAPGGMTPLMMAAGYGNTAMVSLLLQHKASARKKNRDGESAYDLALSGMTDVDGFTWFGCNAQTIAAFEKAEPGIRASAKPSAVRWAKFKRCV